MKKKNDFQECVRESVKNRIMGEPFPYTIDFRVHHPGGLETTKAWRKRARKIVRHLVEEKWRLFEDKPEDRPEDKPAIDRVVTEAFLGPFSDLVGTPMELHCAELTLDAKEKKVTLEWTTKKTQEEKRLGQEASLQLLKKTMQMKRNKNRPPEWERYLQLKPNWPSKAGNLMPLPDPDTVQRQKPMYAMIKDQFAGQVQNAPTNSLIRVLHEYLCLCLPDRP